MSETVETTVRWGISGQFMNNKEHFSQISRLFADLSSASSKLQTIEAQLWNCNQPAWLNSFANRCQRLKRDPGKELISLVYKLEAKKTALEATVSATRANLLELEPSALDTRKTLAGPFSTFSTLPVAQRMKDPDVTARNVVIDAYLDQPDVAICQILDTEFPADDGRPATGLPENWVTQFNVLTYCDAYERCRQRVQTLISKRRRKKHLP